MTKPAQTKPVQAKPDSGVFLDCQAELLGLFGVLVNVTFCMKDRAGRYLDVNDAFVRRWGHSKRDVVGKRPSHIFEDPFAGILEAQDRQVLESGDALRDEMEIIVRADNSLGWYVTTKLPVREDSEVVGLVSLSRDLVVASSSDLQLGSLSAALRLIHEQYAKSLSVGDIAEAAGCSQSKLRRRMKHAFGISPSQYLLRVRVDEAAGLLTTTKLSVADIAARCGFYDQAALTRQFAKLTGGTPSQYRLRTSSSH